MTDRSPSRTTGTVDPATAYRHVLLPVDGSDATAAAVAEAGRLAGFFDATVHVLSVVDSRNRFETPSAGLAPDAWDRAERERSAAAVADALDALPAGVSTERVVRDGVPHDEILDYVDTVGIDVVVMGTHGRTGLDHYLVGSVTERVVRHSPVPVLTVRAAADERG